MTSILQQNRSQRTHFKLSLLERAQQLTLIVLPSFKDGLFRLDVLRMPKQGNIRTNSRFWLVGRWSRSCCHFWLELQTLHITGDSKKQNKIPNVSLLNKENVYFRVYSVRAVFHHGKVFMTWGGKKKARSWRMSRFCMFLGGLFFFSIL